MDFKAAPGVVGLMVGDCSKILSEDELERVWAGHYRVLGVYTNHPTMHDQDATLEYVTRLATPTSRRGAFAWFLIDYYRDFGHSPETGASDGARILEKARALNSPDGMWMTCDGEASHPGNVLGYDQAYAAAASSSPGPCPVLYDAQDMTTEGKDSSGFEIFWRSGMLTAHPPTVGYAMVQHAQTMVAGVPIDPSEVVGDAKGRMPVFAVNPDWTSWDLPQPHPVVPATGPSLALRRIVDGEDNLERLLRIAYESTDPSDRSLLEPGVRSARWTCECRLRSFLWHACTREEDGLAALVTVNGMRFGGDPSAITARGFDASISPFWGPEVRVGHPWGIAPGSIVCTGGHIFLIYACELFWGKAQRSDAVWKLWTIEGGQVTGPCAKGTKSWHLDASGKIVDETIDDGRHVGDVQRFSSRTVAIDSHGSVAGWYSCSAFGGWGLGLPVPAAEPPQGPSVILPPPLDPLLTVRGLQEALKRVGFDPGPLDGIMGVRTKAAIRAFQTSVGLTVDGVVSQPTHDALVAALAKLTAS